MDAVMGLAQFCEIHGPTLVYCTQVFKNTNDFQQQSVLPEECKCGSPKPKFYGPHTLLGFFKDMDGAPMTSKKSSDKKSACLACNVIPPEHERLLSNDHSSQTSFLSSKTALNPALRSLLKHTALRTLSCEVVPGRDGEVFFGDQQRGYVLSRVFQLKDSEARGFKRSFSIFILKNEQHQLAIGFKYLSELIDKVVKRLQHQANRVYESDQRKGLHSELIPESVRCCRNQPKAAIPTPPADDVQHAETQQTSVATSVLESSDSLSCDTLDSGVSFLSKDHSDSQGSVENSPKIKPNAPMSLGLNEHSIESSCDSRYDDPVTPVCERDLMADLIGSPEDSGFSAPSLNSPPSCMSDSRETCPEFTDTTTLVMKHPPTFVTNGICHTRSAVDRIHSSNSSSCPANMGAPSQCNNMIYNVRCETQRLVSRVAPCRTLKGKQLSTRSLIDLTGDRDFFLNIHLQFILVLRLGAKQFVKKPSPIPFWITSEDNYLTRKLTVDVESSHPPAGDTSFKDCFDRVVKRCGPRSCHNMDLCMKPRPIQQLVCMYDLFRILGKDSFRSCLHFLLHGRQILISGEDPDCVQYAASLLMVFLVPLKSLLGSIIDPVAKATDVAAASKVNYECLCGRVESKLLEIPALKIHFSRTDNHVLRATCKGDSAPAKVFSLATNICRVLEAPHLTLRVLQASIESTCLDWVDTVETMSIFARDSPWIGNNELKAFVSSVGGREQDIELINVWNEGKKLSQSQK